MTRHISIAMGLQLARSKLAILGIHHGNGKEIKEGGLRGSQKEKKRVTKPDTGHE